MMSEFPLRNVNFPDRGRFTSIREIRVIFERITLENETRRTILTSAEALSKRAIDLGVTGDQLKSRLTSNLANGEKEVDRLTKILNSEWALGTEKVEKQRASKIVFNELPIKDKSVIPKSPIVFRELPSREEPEKPTPTSRTRMEKQHATKIVFKELPTGAESVKSKSPIVFKELPSGEEPVRQTPNSSPGSGMGM